MGIASKMAATEQKKSLKSSNVKLAARDVVMSYKVIYVLSFVPILYVVYGVLLFRSLTGVGTAFFCAFFHNQSLVSLAPRLANKVSVFGLILCRSSSASCRRLVPSRMRC